MSLENQFLDQLRWRYATKSMNGSKLPADKLNTILEATRLAPASFGLQSFKVLVVENEEIRKAMQPASWNQSQIVDSSQVLVFAIWDNVTDADVENYMQEIVAERGVGRETLDGFKSFIMGTVNGLDQAGRQAWATKQAYIALGFATAAAAVAGVDATPMEGFLPAEIDKILGLEAKGLRSVVMLALGYRNTEGDYLAGAKKVRRSKENLFEFV
jgi:nitroreductase / dihydropteridine reductase